MLASLNRRSGRDPAGDRLWLCSDHDQMVSTGKRKRSGAILADGGTVV
jgi:hypothetical protein